MKAAGKATKWTIGITALAATAAAITPALAHTGPSESAQTKTAKSKVGSQYVVCTSRGKLAKNLSRHIADALKSRESMASVALYDRTTGTTCTFDAHKTYDSASTVKPIVLGALLLAKSGHLTPEEQELAQKMIVHSDNDATTTLWRQLSDMRDPKKPNPVKIQRFLDKAGMKDTVLDRDGSWGLTQVSAADQAKLLKLFTGNSNSVLSEQSRSYALDLMHRVEKTQRWGTPAGAPNSATIQVKNGWLQRSQDGPDNPFDRGDWKVNSMAAFTGHRNGSDDRYDYGLVVLTENNRVPKGEPANVGWDYGIETIEGVARAVHQDLYPQQSLSNGYQPPRPDPEDGST